jgi:hypothetical protein
MVFGAARSAATPTNGIETPLSIPGQKRHPQDPEKDLRQKPKQEANARGVYGYNGCRNRCVRGVNSRLGRLLSKEEGDDIYQMEEGERIRLTELYESQISCRKKMVGGSSSFKQPNRRRRIRPVPHLTLK